MIRVYGPQVEFYNGRAREFHFICADSEQELKQKRNEMEGIVNWCPSYIGIQGKRIFSFKIYNMKLKKNDITRNNG